MTPVEHPSGSGADADRRRVAALVDRAIRRTNAAWDQAHAEFHHALLSACPNKRLRDMALRLRQEFKLYRHWSDALRDDPHVDAAGEHQQLVDAAIARDGALAVQRLAAHIGKPPPCPCHFAR